MGLDCQNVQREDRKCLEKQIQPNRLEINERSKKAQKAKLTRNDHSLSQKTRKLILGR